MVSRVKRQIHTREKPRKTEGSAVNLALALIASSDGITTIQDPNKAILNVNLENAFSPHDEQVIAFSKRTRLAAKRCV